MKRSSCDLYISVALCIVLFPCHISMAVHRPDCAGEGACSCHETLSLDLYAANSRNQRDYYQLLFDINGWLPGECGVYKEHSLFCPQVKECSCPQKKARLKKTENTIKASNAICIDQHAVEALKYALKSKDIALPKTPVCRKIIDLLSDTSLLTENIGTLVFKPFKDNGYERISQWLDNQLVPNVDCTQLEKEAFISDIMEQAAVGLSLSDSPTCYKKFYQAGRILFVCLHGLLSNQYFFIDFVEYGERGVKAREGYVLSFPNYEEAITFDTWEKLKIFVDAYLLAQLVFCMDLYLFGKTDDLGFEGIGL